MKSSSRVDERRRLSDVAILWDSLHKTPQYVEHGWPMVRVTDIRSGYLKTAGTVRVTEETFREFTKRYQPRGGDTVFSRVGSYGNSSYIAADEPLCLGQNTVCISPRRDVIDPFFLYAFLVSPDAREQIESRVGGASQPTISLKNISTIEVPYPSIVTQRCIASILSSYDDLIENNTRRIAILEEMARRIYEEWFVRFRFPGYEGVRMVESDLGLVPEGWEQGSFGQLIEFEKGKKPQETFASWSPGRVPALLIDALRGGAVEFAAAERLVVVTRSDTIMVMDGSGSGQVFVGHEGAIGSTLGRYRIAPGAPVGAHWLYLYFLTHQADISAKNIGAAIPHANKDYIRSMPLVVPAREVASAFEKVVAPMFALVERLKAKNGNLRATRDLLLPRLISGELDVSAMSEPEALAA
jgi:type I restriction enzyme S subunit